MLKWGVRHLRNRCLVKVDMEVWDLTSIELMSDAWSLKDVWEIYRKRTRNGQAMKMNQSRGKERRNQPLYHCRMTDPKTLMEQSSRYRSNWIKRGRQNHLSIVNARRRPRSANTVRLTEMEIGAVTTTVNDSTSKRRPSRWNYSRRPSDRQSTFTWRLCHLSEEQFRWLKEMPTSRSRWSHFQNC